MPQTVLITGGAGFIGATLADAPAAEGRDVLVHEALLRLGVEGGGSRADNLGPGHAVSLRRVPAVIGGIVGHPSSWASRTGVGDQRDCISDARRAADFRLPPSLPWFHALGRLACRKPGIARGHAGVRHARDVFRFQAFACGSGMSRPVPCALVMTVASLLSVA